MAEIAAERQTAEEAARKAAEEAARANDPNYNAHRGQMIADLQRAEFDRIYNASNLKENGIDKSFVDNINDLLIEKLGFSPDDLTNEDQYMLFEGVIFSIDDNFAFSISQKLSDMYPYEGNYYFMRAKTFTDAVFASAYGTAALGSAVAAAQALVNSGAAQGFALATSPTIYGGVAFEAAAVEELARAGVLGITSIASKGMFDRSTRILNEDAAKLQSISKPVKVLIREVSDDILDTMEKAGGHTLEKHVGISNQDLIKRAIKEETTATSFIDKATAINAVKENLRRNANNIEKWSSALSTKPIVLECEHSFAIGKGTTKSSKSIIYDLNKSRLVLEKNSSSELGFIIKTAFPIFN